MDLPCEIWEKIIIQIKDVKECIKLFKSFPKITQEYIREVFENHMESIKTKILYSFENCLFLAIENKRVIIFMDDDLYNDIEYVRIMNNDNIVSVDKKGKIIFWDSKKYKFIDCIEIDSNLENIEFHPTESRMIVSLIRENLGLEFQSILLKKNGIDFNQTLLAYEPEFLMKIVYHPTLPYVLLIRHKNYQIYTIYLWKYNETNGGGELEYSAFERIELPFIMNSGIEYFENFIYMYYLPFRILENGDFECLGKGVFNYYILKMKIKDNKFYQKENQRILYNGRQQVFDYVRVNHKIIYLVDGYKIIEQDGADSRIIYENNQQPISELTYKDDCIIFLENIVFKKININNFGMYNVEEIINIQKPPSDFCVL
jgi:hypothetical protein